MIKKIRSMDDTRQVCIYDTENRNYHIENDKEFSIKRDIGFCAILESGVYGVFTSEAGPVFFVNDQLYYLKNMNYIFTHRHLEEKVGEFTFTVDEKTELKIVYQITSLTDYDSWSSEKEVDFFQWLTNQHEKQEDTQLFQDFYTRL
jgi:hypothetical protein